MLTKSWREKNDVLVTVLQASRREAKLTQRELAERLPKWLKWTQSTLGKVEKGRRRLDLIEFVELAKALKLDPATLFDRFTRWK